MGGGLPTDEGVADVGKALRGLPIVFSPIMALARGENARFDDELLVKVLVLLLVEAVVKWNIVLCNFK
jgi:hypothetical protein